MYNFKLADAELVLKINSKTDKKYPVSSVYVAGTCEDELLTACVFTLSQGSAEILDVIDFNNASDSVLMTVLKSAMNYIDLYGIKNVVCKNSELKKLLKEAGFKSNDEKEYFLDLNGYFEGGCGNKMKG